MIIPKKIHYCWFGRGTKSEAVLKCIESWKKFCQDYEIIEWNEDNYDVDKINFTKQAYEKKAWAFVSDYARLDIVNQYGGIYMDTDVELIKKLDDFLGYEMYAGFESCEYVNYGLGFGSIAAHPYLREQMEIYENMNYISEDGSVNRVNCPLIQTKVLKRHGLKEMETGKIQILEHACIFPTEYFSPKSFQTGEITCTDNTVSIHHFAMSWISDEQKYYAEREQKLKKKYGLKLGKLISMITSAPGKIKIHYREEGWKGLKKYLLSFFKRKK